MKSPYIFFKFVLLLNRGKFCFFWFKLLFINIKIGNGSLQNFAFDRAKGYQFFRVEISTEAASTTLSAKDATVIRSINYLDLFYGSIVCESKPFPGELDLVEFYAVKGFLFTLEPGQRISRRSRSKKTLTCEEVVIGKFSSLTRFGKLQEISFNKNTDIVTMAEILLGDHLKCDITSSDIIAVGNDPLNVSFV